MALTPDGRLVLAAVEGPGALVIIDEETHTTVARVPTGRKAHGVDVSSEGRFAYVTNRDDGTLSVVDLAGLRVVSQIPVGKSPAGVDFVPLP